MNPNIERVLDIWAKEHDANIKYVGHLSNEIQFMVDDYRFIIHYPLDYPHMDEGENFFVEIDDKCCIDWLKDINRYILDVKPNLRRLLIHMDKMYCRSKMDSLDVDDQMEEILEETELKKKLVGNLRNNQPVGKILIQEFLENKKEYASNKKIALSLTGDDIYMWNVKYTLPNTTVLQERFGYNYIEVEILFHNVLYPDYPPYLRVVRPKFKDALHEKIAHLKIVRAGYWSPKRKIKQVINKMANIFEKYAVVDIDEPLNSLLSYPYNDFEDALCELVSLSNDETDDPVDNAKYDRVEKSEQLIDKQDYDVAILINNLKTILKSSNKIELLPERINGSHLLDTLWSHSFDERDGNNNLEKVNRYLRSYW